jgi:hypothetical protein
LITNHQRLPLGALGKGGHEIGLARLVPVAQTTRRQQIFCGNLTARRNQRMMWSLPKAGDRAQCV